MSNPNALFLLADHIKLSLLERQRAETLNLDSDSQDGHISRSLEQFKDGLESLEAEQKRIEEGGEEDKALSISESLPSLQKQYSALTSQFHGFSPTSTTTTTPNDPSLAADFAEAASTKRQPNKSGRFASPTADLESGPADPSRETLFPYRDEPENAGYRDAATDLDNVQVHAYHQRIMAEQDEQLDALGASIGRQRELSMQIGDELDDHVAMLDETEGLVDRHQSRLDRARKQVGRIARAGGENKGMTIIVVLIVVLVLLIAVTK